MFEGKLKKEDGTEIVFQIPETCREIKFRAKLDFDDACLRILNYLAEAKEDFNSGYYLYLMSYALTEFFTTQNTPSDAKNPKEYALDFHALYNVDVSDLIEEDGSLKAHVMKNHMELYKGKPSVDIQNSQLTLSTIYEHIYAVLTEYEYNEQQNDFCFTYKGEEFKVFGKHRDSILGFAQYDKVTLGELTEAFEVSRQVNKLNKTGKQPTSVKLTEHLHLLAILARKKGETLPMENTEQFIDVRARHFLDIDFQTSSDVFFYLIHSLTTSQKETIVSSFLTHLNQQISTIPMNLSKNKSEKMMLSGKGQDLILSK